jgi:epoxyqueuosine reductase
VGLEHVSPVGEPTSYGRLADELRLIGRQGGLDAVGICEATPFSDTRKAIVERKQLGLSAGMQFTYRNPARSTDPQATLPGARSLFVGVRRYLRRDPPARTEGSPSGRVARYSWVDHYRPLRGALGLVAARLIDDGWQARVAVDDNALVDRAAAVRAGIGWYGKNSNVLVQGAGSWFVIGSVITDAPIAPLTPPAPVADGCGSCHHCITACPTGALVGPGRLDARKCLAWLVQAPGLFPRQYREALGDRIYGCDDCQSSCPINRRSERTHPPPDPEPGSQPSVDILSLLGADDTTLLDLVGRWYIPQRQPRYVRRNALIVLGNTADPAAPGVSAALERALADPDPIVRAHAVWAAGRLGRGDLVQGLDADGDPLVSDEIANLPPPSPIRMLSTARGRGE